MSNEITSIYDFLIAFLDSVRKPLAPISSILINSGAIIRPGLSPIMITSNIIRRQSEAGAYFGPLKDGSANVSEAMERVRVEEIVNAIKSDMKVEISIPPGSITIGATPNNGSLTNINFVHGDGIAR